MNDLKRRQKILEECIETQIKISPHPPPPHLQKSHYSDIVPYKYGVSKYWVYFLLLQYMYEHVPYSINWWQLPYIGLNKKPGTNLTFLVLAQSPSPPPTPILQSANTAKMVLSFSSAWLVEALPILASMEEGMHVAPISTTARDNLVLFLG